MDNPKPETQPDMRSQVKPITELVAVEVDKLSHTGRGDEVFQFLLTVIASIGAVAGVAGARNGFDTRTHRKIREALNEALKAAYRAGVKGRPVG